MWRVHKLLVAAQLLALFLVLDGPERVVGKGQYVMPLLGGMKMSVSYDIANVFIRPIASFITVFLSICMLFILVNGIITSPFGYMFGIPSRKYVLGTKGNPLTSQGVSRSLDWQFLNGSSSSLEQMLNLPTFEDQVFYLLPKEVQTESCRLLALCHAHNVITRLPRTILKAIRLFSERLVELSDDHREAILKGIQFEEDCSQVYDTCKDSGYTVVVKTLMYWLPSCMKNHKQRRKRAMYM